jgi:hypothetical protein
MFRIFYYDNSPNQYVKPLDNTFGQQLIIFASNPPQATEMAEKYMRYCGDYNHHIPRIGCLSSMVHEDDLDKWREGDPEVLW